MQSPSNTKKKDGEDESDQCVLLTTENQCDGTLRQKPPS